MYSNEQWSALVERTFKTIQNLAQSKGAEYSGDVDRLLNFRRQAGELDLTKEKVLFVYAGKHWDSLRTYVKDRAAGRKRVYSEPIDGRAHDMIVYMLLFLAMLEEEDRVQKSALLAQADQVVFDPMRNQTGVFRER